MARPVDPIGSRREARESALAILYAAESRGVGLLEVLADQTVAPGHYAIELVEGVAGVMAEVDVLIDRFAEGWRTDRMLRSTGHCCAWRSMSCRTGAMYPRRRSWPRWWSWPATTRPNARPGSSTAWCRG